MKNNEIDDLKIAVVHDWLVTYAGAEKVLEQIINIYPQADIFSLVEFLPIEQRRFLKEKRVNVSFIQNLPFSSTKYRMYLPLMPLAVEQFDLSDYDLVISSSYAVAKGVITGPDQLHICYCHSPIRYAWDLQHQYLKESGISKGLRGWLARWFLHKMRIWDVRTANGVDYFIANSHYISRRIKKVYGRDAVTIYPNVAVDSFDLVQEKDDYYLTVSRLVPYKKIALIVQAFAKMPDKKLVVIGDGPEMSKIKSYASKNIEILGYQPFDSIKKYMSKAKAFVYAAEEDFGIVPVEAQACGTPVIAFGRGGVTETVLAGKTGLFFYEQNERAICEKVSEFERDFELDSNFIRTHAEQFSTDAFKNKISKFIDDRYKKFIGSRH
ncbi:glycosyltransferase family 4 protein [Marinobacter nauticus]|uniref:Glycosyltransferase involved in cell wall biosynthesis n=1 Tax=Marinobacter nauticus TaxID=2743 RepID=A0A368UTM8_MARNT|nr:glycosyltransferase family 4 protein [Marinobacter nauticus]RBP69265.1 glycosyltransferase involved in cell wall biosynthesis [Marinobacter nauticus]RCW30744.1 glycosyltransferase involved in cell wall biosynthesis [Marinobacter nauticus]